MVQQELMAFWKYDQFPYLLWGTITNFGSEGRIQTIEYGYGNWFAPKFILAKEDGIHLSIKLDKLRNDRNSELKKLEDKYNNLLEEMISK